MLMKRVLKRNLPPREGVIWKGRSAYCHWPFPSSTPARNPMLRRWQKKQVWMRKWHGKYWTMRSVGSEHFRTRLVREERIENPKECFRPITATQDPIFTVPHPELPQY